MLPRCGLARRQCRSLLSSVLTQLQPLRRLSLPIFPAHATGSPCHERNPPSSASPSSLLASLSFLPNLIISGFSVFSSLPPRPLVISLTRLSDSCPGSLGPSWAQFSGFAQSALSLSMGCGSDNQPVLATLNVVCMKGLFLTCLCF